MTSSTVSSTGTCCKPSAVAKDTSAATASNPTAASVVATTVTGSSTPSGSVSGSSKSSVMTWFVGIAGLLVFPWMI